MTVRVLYQKRGLRGGSFWGKVRSGLRDTGVFLKNYGPQIAKTTADIAKPMIPIIKGLASGGTVRPLITQSADIAQNTSKMPLTGRGYKKINTKGGFKYVRE